MKWADLGALFTPTEKTKLAGIATGADVTGSNAPQSHSSSHEYSGSDLVAAGKIHIASGHPGSPADGWMYFNTTTKRICVYHAASGGWGGTAALTFE